MSRGPLLTQAEFDYLKVLQKRKVGAIEVAVQTGRDIRTVRKVYRSTDLAGYKALRSAAKPRQATLKFDVPRTAVPTLAEQADAYGALSDLYWHLNDRLNLLEQRLAELTKAVSDKAEIRRKWGW